MKIVLIGNYAADRQESMERFVKVLYDGFEKEGVAIAIWSPAVILGKWVRHTNNGLGKWAGYFDKWILFPLLLIFKKKRNAFFHICDHSNAFYLKFLPINKTSITCHDVLAIKGALGDKKVYCNASFTGKLLQQCILHNLKNAKKLAAVSVYTLGELQHLIDEDKRNKKWVVIHNGLNQPFGIVNESCTVGLLRSQGLSNKRFLLHVGSALPRKNRKMLVEMLRESSDNLLYAVFAGKPADKFLQQIINDYGMQDRCIFIEQPTHELLTALYNCCAAFIFPSYSEGFGWPVIEAQACGAPVIASNNKPMPEIGGNGALYANPDDAAAFVSQLERLNDVIFKESLVQKGFENIQRFSTEDMVSRYLNLVINEL